MADRVLTSARVDRPYRSLRVYWPTSIRLRWIARVDRRGGLPLGLSPATTPILHELITWHDDVCEHERTSCLADVEAIQVRLSEIGIELRALQRQVESLAAAAERAAVPLTEDQLSVRLAGEHNLAETVTRRRRSTTHQLAADAARDLLLAARHDLDTTLAEQAQLETRRVHRWEVARSRVLRYGQFTRRRATIYRRALVRRHPQREQLVQQWQTELCTTPDWALPGAGEPTIVSTGVAA